MFGAKRRFGVDDGWLQDGFARHCVSSQISHATVEKPKTRNRRPQRQRFLM